MTPHEVKLLAESICANLISSVARASSVEAIGNLWETSLRYHIHDAIASQSLKYKQSWRVVPEKKPTHWVSSPVDTLVFRLGHKGREQLLGGIEFKWWRHNDNKHLNRQTMLFKDILRCAALSDQKSDFSFFALVCTENAWSNTRPTVMASPEFREFNRLFLPGKVKWSLDMLEQAIFGKNAIEEILGKTPFCTHFHTELLAASTANLNGKLKIASGVWGVKKPQNSHIFYF